MVPETDKKGCTRRAILPLMTRASHRPLRIGLLGVGTVGAALAGLIRTRDDLVLHKALVRDLDKPRPISRPDEVLTTDVDEVFDDIDLLVELMGGTTGAVTHMERALQQGIPVVTANKAALAERWDVFLPAMREGRVFFEASVMAGTPAIEPVAGVLRGSAPRELHAVLNGTCSYILGQLEQGTPYQQALAEAQRLGYAEADPTLDVSGLDAAHKLTILARLSVDPALQWSMVREATRGIESLTPGIVLEAMEDGGRVQLVGSVTPQDGAWLTQVRPVYLPAGHPLATSEGAAMWYRGEGGDVLITGPGAGGIETASAVFGDVLAASSGRPGPRPLEARRPEPHAYTPAALGDVTPA